MNIKRAQIEVSSKCNYKCVTCRHGYYEYGQNLPPKICNILIQDILPSLNVLELQGTGESLLNGMTSQLIKAAGDNTEITLITNGSLLTDEIMNILVSERAQVVISLDGSNEEIYELHRPVGSFSKVIRNVQRLNEIRRGVHDCGCSIVVNMVLTRLNIMDIKNMIELVSSLGLDFLFVSEVRRCMPDSKVWDNLNLLSESSTQDFKSMIRDCEDFASKKGIGFRFNPNLKPAGIKKKVCPAAWEHIFVSSNGDVSICCELPKFFGNLNVQNISEILSCRKLKEFQYDMLNGCYDQHCLNCCLPWGLPYE